MKQVGWSIVVAMLTWLVPAPAAAQGKTLDIYFIDVEGGQATLVVTPAGEALLIDTGFAGEGTFACVPAADADAHVAGTQKAFDAYARVRATGRHLTPKPGDKIPLKGIDTVVVSAAGATLQKPLPGAGDANPACGAAAPAAQEPTENPRSTGIRLRFGQFTFLDVGDLTGAPLFALVCPRNLIGPTDLYLVAHHGGADAGDAASFAAIAPRVAILNNGEKKGGAPEVLAALHQARGLEDAWQLHRSLPPGARFFKDDRIANLDQSTAHWLKVSAKMDGSFAVTNGRTGETKSYGVRSGASRPSPRSVK